MRFRNQVFGILSLVLSGLFLHIFKETSWAIVVERFLEEAAHSLHIERAEMIATLSQILILAGVMYAALYFAFRVGRAERPVPPDPALEVARAHTQALREQTAALRMPPREPYSLPESPAASLPSWLDLEKRFRELEGALAFCRISHQSGDAGEHWRFGGTGTREAQDRFHATIALASKRLKYDFDLSENEDLAQESDPKIRWYKALRYLGEAYEMSPNYAWQVKEDGSKGFIFTAFIDKPAAASATLCLSLASKGA